MIQLRKSPVVFNEDEHRYFLGDKELRGITSTLIRRAFPDKYKDVAPEVLANAARKGKELHSLIEYHDNFHADASTFDDPRVQAYEQLKAERGLTTVANEYLVSDETRYASSIDLVLTNQRGEICLADIKTTWSLDRQSAALQLSIYRRFFERQNPGLKVSDIYVIWLPNKDRSMAEIHCLRLVPDEVIDALIEADIADTTFDITAFYGTLPARLADVEDEIILIEQRMKDCKQRSDELKKGLYELMEKSDVKSFAGTKVKLTRVLPTESETFDTSRFKAEHPDTYKAYIKKTKKAGSLRITINQ